VLPALIIILTSAVTDFSDKFHEYRRSLLIPALVGVLMSYVILGNFIVGLSAFLIRNEGFWLRLIITAAVPPAVAVTSLAGFRVGNEPYAVMGAAGAYVGALVIVPRHSLRSFGHIFY